LTITPSLGSNSADFLDYLTSGGHQTLPQIRTSAAGDRPFRRARQL